MIGQVTLALSNGVLSFIVLTFVFLIGSFGDLDVRYSALLAFIAFLGSLIPLVGTLYRRRHHHAARAALRRRSRRCIVVGIYYLVYMQVEAYVLSPRIMSRRSRSPARSS